MTVTAVCQDCHWEGPEELVHEDGSCVACGSYEVFFSSQLAKFPQSAIRESPRDHPPEAPLHIVPVSP
jgi:hypothetical protein